MLRGLRAVPQEVHHDLQRSARLAAGELLHRRRQLAILDRQQRFGQRVEADHRHLPDQHARLQRFNRAQRHVVVGRVDHRRRGVRSRQTVLGHAQAVCTVEVRRLLEHDRILLGHAVQHVVQTSVAVNRRRCARRALQVEHLRAIREQRQDQLALRLAAQHVVRADVRQRVAGRVARHIAVDRHHRDPGVDHFLNGRGQRICRARRDDQAVVAFSDDRFQVGDLLGRVVLPVERHQIDAADARGLVADLALHVHEEGELQAGHRECDAQRVLRRRCEHAGHQREQHENESQLPKHHFRLLNSHQYDEQSR